MKCTGCGTTDPAAFFPSKPNRCRDCHRAYQREYERTPEGREKANARTRRNYWSDPEKARAQARERGRRFRERLAKERASQ